MGGERDAALAVSRSFHRPSGLWRGRRRAIFRIFGRHKLSREGAKQVLGSRERRSCGDREREKPGGSPDLTKRATCCTVSLHIVTRWASRRQSVEEGGSCLACAWRAFVMEARNFGGG